MEGAEEEDWTYVARAYAKMWGWRKGSFGTTYVYIRCKIVD